MLGRGACLDSYPAGRFEILELLARFLSPDGAGGIPGGGGISSIVSCLRQTRGGAPVPLRLQRVCGFFVVPFWQERQPSV